MSKFSPGNSKAAKLSNEDVFEMRRLYQDEGWSQARLARHFGVVVNTVGRIVRGESRQRVPMPVNPEEVAKRLMDLQSEKDAGVLARISAAITNHPATKAREAAEELDRFVDPTAKSRYGITEE